MRKKKISKSIFKSAGNIPVVASVIVLVAFIAGLLLGSLVIVKSIGGKTTFSSSGVVMTGGYADGWNAAKKKVADSGMFPHQNGVLSGKIKQVNGDEVSFTAPLINPLDDQSLTNRTAVITKDTVINLYRQKTSDQIAADQKTAQSNMADARSQLSSLQSQESKCMMMAPTASTSTDKSDCQTVNKKYNAAQQEMNAAMQLSDMFTKVDNATASDLKADMQVTVYGAATAQTGNQVMPGNYADISGQVKFNVSQIVAREVQAAPTPSIPVATPVK